MPWPLPVVSPTSDVGAGCNPGTGGGALLFQLAVVDGVGVIGTGGNVSHFVAGGIDVPTGSPPGHR